MEPEYRCIVCGGPLIFLGTLANFDHYRCRNCGSDSPKVAEKPVDEASDLDQHNPVDCSAGCWREIYANNPDLLDFDQSP